MTIRQSIKLLLYGKTPWISGAFPYFGTKVYFPKNSIIFTIACTEGIFERDNVIFLQKVVKPNTLMFDVGANIGLMAVPILQSCPTCKVVSVEPSPNVLPFLHRTIRESTHTSRWTLVAKAAGHKEYQTTFTLSPQYDSIFDGFRHTNRTRHAASIDVSVTTLDAIWKSLGKPEVSVIKCDIEGADTEAIHGATECIKVSKPMVLIEWNSTNLEAYNTPRAALIELTQSIGYHLFAVPSYAEITDIKDLLFHMRRTETFVMTPTKDRLYTALS